MAMATNHKRLVFHTQHIAYRPPTHQRAFATALTATTPVSTYTCTYTFHPRSSAEQRIGIAEQGAARATLASARVLAAALAEEARAGQHVTHMPIMMSHVAEPATWNLGAARRGFAQTTLLTTGTST
eukprot:scaffold38769_cov35-Tisochrysis_lutea.AAC.7